MSEANSPLDLYFEALLSPVVERSAQVAPSEIKIKPHKTKKVVVEEAQSIILPEGCPAWVNGQFPILPFRLGGLQFALPKFQVGSVIPWPQDLSSPPEQPAWALGQLISGEGRIWVANTLQIILPAGKQPKPSYQMLLVGDSVALACDTVAEEVMLDPNQVKWRQERTHRPWLLGMLATSPCALVDFEQMISG